MAFLYENLNTSGSIYIFDDPEATPPADAPPSFVGGLASDSITTESFNVNYTLDEDCTSYLIVVAQGSAIPTPAQIKAGVDYGAVTVLFSANESATALVADSLAVTGLSAQSGQQVTVYMTAEDLAFNLQAQDGVRSLTVTLAEVNQPPTVSGNYTQQTTIVDQAFSFDGSANFSDTDALTYSLSGITGASINATSGLITWTPDTVGVYSGTVTATDTAGQSVGAQLPVNVIASPEVTLRPYNRTSIWQGSKTPNFVLGDYFIHTITLYHNSPSEVCSVVGADSIKVALVTDDHSARLTDAVTLSSSETGASWAGGIVVINMTEAITAQAASVFSKSEYAKVEIEVVLGGNSFTWFAPVKVIPGYID